MCIQGNNRELLGESGSTKLGFQARSASGSARSGGSEGKLVPEHLLRLEVRLLLDLQYYKITTQAS